MGPNLACLERLARAAGTSPTLKVACRRLWEALPPAWGVQRVDFVTCLDNDTELQIVSAGQSEGRVQTWSSSAQRSGSIAERVLQANDVLVEEHAPAAARAAGHAVCIVGFALDLPRGSKRCVILQLAKPFSSLRLKPQLLSAVIRIFEAAIAHVELVERVAQLSQRAHHESHQLRQQLDRLTEQPGIVAESTSMRQVVSVAEQVAEHDISVLLLGESGTGKELIARHVHLHSPRRAGPFVAVNCGALPETLIESELFGHEKGAFTGASARRLGRFERAHRGTIFLDEVGDLPLASQVKLLRVLQERSLQRVGGESAIAIDVRVIAATHRPLADMVADKTFRQDLYYRLRAFPIEIPPLRDRPEDIVALVQRRLAQLCQRMRRSVPAVSPATLASLCAAPWPGNVRELENAIERALIMSPGDQLELTLALESQPIHRGKADVQTFKEASRRAIAAALEATDGRIYGTGGAAELLDLKPSTLQTKMEKLGIVRRA